MKNYTVVYGEWFKRGSMRGSVTKYKYITTDDLDAWMRANKDIDMGDIWFIFEGHIVEVKS